ncbi:hypothetical protein [Microcoleus sp. B4-D4]|uniref:hypothetical protein n=1 Tax=Microcoleus sp. B4-D4 TaxID=2818667 RepID=UPI002FD68413
MDEQNLKPQAEEAVNPSTTEELPDILSQEVVQLHGDSANSNAVSGDFYKDIGRKFNQDAKRSKGGKAPPLPNLPGSSGSFGHSTNVS